MEYKNLGKSSLKVSELSLGTALTIGQEINDREVIKDILQTAFNNGINYIDLSSNYGNAESIFGSLLKNFDRENLVISSKCGWKLGDKIYDQGLSKKNIHQSLNRSLNNIKTDYLDVFYAHRYDPEVSFEEVAITFNNLISRGLIFHWGTSEWPVNILEKLYKYCLQNGLETPIVDQTIFNLAVNKSLHNGRIDLCKNYGIGYMGYSVLCQGLLTGKYHKSGFSQGRISKADKINYNKTIVFYEQNKNRIDLFINYAKINSIEPISLAMAYALNFSNSVLMGVSSKEQLLENINNYNLSKKILKNSINDLVNI